MNTYTIYRVTCTITNKIYIGYTSKTLEERIKTHKHDYKHRKTKFYNALIKYKWENFKWEAIYQSLELTHTKNFMESYFITEHDSYHGGYNSTKGGDGIDASTAKSICQRPDTIRKKRLAAQKLWESPDYQHSMKVGREHYWNLYHSDPASKEQKKIKCKEVNKRPEVIEKQRTSHTGHTNYRYNHAIYTFIHKDGRIETTTQNEMCSRYNLCQPNVTAMLKGRQKSVSGWSLG
jgi:group I intron endonuclease